MYKKKYQNRKHQKGFTLVEVLVSSVLLTIVIISGVVLIKEGREMDISDAYRRDARYLIYSKFDSTFFSNQNYASISSLPNEVLYLSSNPTCSIPCTLKTHVTTEKDSVADKSSLLIKHKIITLTAKWYGPEGPDSVELQKWITNL